ncbi:MAG: hypothetical protein JXR76_28515 [Deltaproteobacteria bacterium]|nr:hypothetical protein [Deltaproteobacteria bacterium]
MSIPAYIIDEILKERARRHSTVYEELHIEHEMPKEPPIKEPPAQEIDRGVAEVDFFLY